MPLRIVTCGGAQVALQQRLILRPGNKQNNKKSEKGGQFSIVATGQSFSVLTGNNLTIIPARGIFGCHYDARKSLRDLVFSVRQVRK